MKKSRRGAWLSLAVATMLALFLLSGCSLLNSVTTPKPTASASNVTNAVVGTAFDLDGSFSSNANSETFLWTLTKKAPGSLLDSTDISSNNQAIASFTPDIAGKYTFVLKVTNAAGSITTTLTVTVKDKSISTIAIPSGLVASASTASTVTLSWTQLAGILGYRLYSSTVSGSGYAQVGTDIAATATTYQDKGLTANTDYYYVIAAFNALGEGPKSTEVTRRTSASSSGAAAVITPTGLSAGTATASTTNAGYFKVTLTWTAVANATGYNIYVNEYGTAWNYLLPYYYVAGGTSTSLTAGDVLPSTDNYYFITAFNADGLETAPSVGVLVTTGTLTDELPAPTGLAAGTPATTGVPLSWTKVAGADGYYVYYETTNVYDRYSYNWIWVSAAASGITESIPASDMSLASNTTYYFWVTAYSYDSGEGPESAASATAKTAAAVVVPTTGTVGTITVQ